MRDIFSAHNINDMNETDVREILVRPLLHELGYQQGAAANIVTEKKLSYSYVFLGRKKPGKDPALAGKADYICDVTSFGRWVVEAKSPKRHLTLDDAQQAHTYAAHPEIAAIYFLLTNGREFRLYQTSRPGKPIMIWTTEQTLLKMMNIKNLLAPEAIKKRVYIPLDPQKPLARGYNSAIELIGGHIVREGGSAEWQPLAEGFKKMEGMRMTVTGKTVARTQDGRIEGELVVIGPFSVFDAINKAAGINSLVFSSSDEYISQNVEMPTIFQGISIGQLVAGGRLPPFPGGPSAEFNLPYGVSWASHVEAVGYINNDRLKGTFETRVLFQHHTPPELRDRIPPQAAALLHGTFDIIIR
jgi:hypothetical protein